MMPTVGTPRSASERIMSSRGLAGSASDSERRSHAAAAASSAEFVFAFGKRTALITVLRMADGAGGRLPVVELAPPSAPYASPVESSPMTTDLPRASPSSKRVCSVGSLEAVTRHRKKR